MNVAFKLKARTNPGNGKTEWSCTLINDGRVVARTRYAGSAFDASVLGRARALREGWKVIST